MRDIKMRDMKTIVPLLIIIIFGSIAAGYIAGFFVYVEYRRKSAYLDRQVSFTMDKFTEMENNLREFSIDLQNRVDEGSAERRKVLAKLESIREDLEEWKRGYKAALSGLRGEIKDIDTDKLTRMVENIQDEIDGFKMKVQDLDIKVDEARGNTANVDLGKISVGKKKR